MTMSAISTMTSVNILGSELNGHSVLPGDTVRDPPAELHTESPVVPVSTMVHDDHDGMGALDQGSQEPTDTDPPENKLENEDNQSNSTVATDKLPTQIIAVNQVSAMTSPESTVFVSEPDDGNNNMAKKSQDESISIARKYIRDLYDLSDSDMSVEWTRTADKVHTMMAQMQQRWHELDKSRKSLAKVKNLQPTATSSSTDKTPVPGSRRGVKREFSKSDSDYSSSGGSSGRPAGRRQVHS